MRLYYTLSDYPHETVEIECAKCGRHGRLRTARLTGGFRIAAPLFHRPRKRARSVSIPFTILHHLRELSDASH